MLRLAAVKSRPEVVMSALDGVLIGLISDLLLAAWDEVEDGVHPAYARLPRLSCPAGCYGCRVCSRLLQLRTVQRLPQVTIAFVQPGIVVDKIVLQRSISANRWQ